MYLGHDMMYNVYPGQNNGNPNTGSNPYSLYNNMYSDGSGMRGSPMMYAYGNGGYGFHIDPAVAASFEHKRMFGNNNISSSMGNGNYGNGGRGGYGGISKNSSSGNYNTINNKLRCGGGGGSFDDQTPPVYEVHVNQLKAPVTVTMETVVPTVGSSRLFSRPPKPIIYGSRSVVRICDAFQEGRCLAADKCHDIHVKPEFLAETRMQMSAWLVDREKEFRQTLETNPTKTFRIFVADLKEVVEVPVTSLVFTKGLYVDPTTRAKRARGIGNHFHAHAATQVPTSCGLYSTDPAQCKWGRWCNQVHIDHQWMHSKKEEFDHWFNELQTRYFSLAPDDNFTVHDPQLKASISLPKFSIAEFSRGLFQGSTKKLASVCLLYQRGKCTAGSCCNQVHVVPQYLSLAREYAILKQSPDASPEEKLYVAHEMQQLRGPCIEQQQREQQKAEKAAVELVSNAATTTTKSSASNPLQGEHADDHTHSNNSGNAEDEFNSSGALFEHVQVDEDVEPVSQPASANTSFTRRLNASRPDIALSSGRHVNSDGSYSFNPYGSVTSLPEASTSYGRASTGRGNSTNLESSSIVQYTPGNVQLHSTGGKGGRRLVAFISPEASSSTNEVPRVDETGTSNTVDVNGHANGMTDLYPHMPGVLRGGMGTGGMGSSISAYRAAMHHRGMSDGLFDGFSAAEHNNFLHSLDFDASLHFSSLPLLNFDESGTSLYRNGSTREEEAVNNMNLRLASSNTSAPHPGKFTNSQPYLNPATQQSASGYGAKSRFSAGPTPTRPRPRTQPSASSPVEISTDSRSNATMRASRHTMPSAPSVVTDGGDGAH